MPLNFLTLFLTFLQAGGLCIGDGYATIVPLRRAIVKKNSWMTDDDFSRHIAIVQTMPGVFNVNLANYFGKYHGHDSSPTLFIFTIFHLLQRARRIKLGSILYARCTPRHCCPYCPTLPSNVA